MNIVVKRKRVILNPPMNSPEIYEQPCEEAVKRLIVIDGCNVARASCGPGRGSVDCIGLLATVRFLLVRDFDCVSFIPITYNNALNVNVSHSFVLQKMQMLGLLTFTSARTANGYRRAFLNYDDLYVLEFAYRHGGCVLSGDRFEDILKHPSYSEFHNVILDRRMGVQFFLLDTDSRSQFFKIEDDRFYRTYPRFCLEEGEEDDLHLRACLYSVPHDSEYRQVSYRRSKWSKERRQHLLEAVDLLLDIVQNRDLSHVHYETSKNAIAFSRHFLDQREMQRRVEMEERARSSSSDSNGPFERVTEQRIPSIVAPRCSSSSMSTTSSCLRKAQNLFRRSSATSKMAAARTARYVGDESSEFSESETALSLEDINDIPSINDDQQLLTRDNLLQNAAPAGDMVALSCSDDKCEVDEFVEARAKIRKELAEFLDCELSDEGTNGGMVDEIHCARVGSELDGINFYETPEQTAERRRKEDILALFNERSASKTTGEQFDFSGLSQFQLDANTKIGARNIIDDILAETTSDS